MKFEEALANMPREFRGEIIETDAWLKALRPVKFRRTADKNGQKITYVASEYGVSYMFKISDEGFSHNFQWYIVYNGKPETWHRRADYMEEALEYIAKADHALAARVWSALKGCQGGDSCYGTRCLARTVYAFEGQKKLICHGSAALGTRPEDFRDAREFFRYFNELIKEKIAGGEPPRGKIIVCQTNRSLQRAR